MCWLKQASSTADERRHTGLPVRIFVAAIQTSSSTANRSTSRTATCIQSAGATSILDLMLALVEEDLGSELALRVAQGMVMFLRRPANQSQFSVQLTALKTGEKTIRDVVSHIAEHPGADLTVERLSELAAMSPRNFTRVFSREIGMTPGKFVELSRLESARRYLEQSTLPVSQIASECGYSTTDGMRLAFNRNLGVTPREYRMRFC